LTDSGRAAAVALAEALVQRELAKLGCRDIDLALQRKGDPSKTAIARQLREQTPMSRRWIAERLKMGSPSYLSALTSVNSKV